MNLFHFQTPPTLIHRHHHNRFFSPLNVTCQRQTPPTDITITFGKFKGKMLGTLPSSYLKWVSTNLRARDSEEWAILADHVLKHPFYKDRMEWEFAQNILTGNQSKAYGNAVSELLEVSERFGWDNDDKKGWREIDFELLGTSKGGRIPRLEERSEGGEGGGERGRKVLEVDVGDRERRRERRRKRREEGGITKLGLEGRGSLVNGNIDGDSDGGIGGLRRETEINGKKFPGREGLLRKVMNGGRFGL